MIFYNKLLVSGDYFYIHPSFTSPNWGASTFENVVYVDDNDDRDWYVDGSGVQYLPYDRDSNGINDWEQNLFLLNADPPKFFIGEGDRNNNGVADDQENDPYPDYPYRFDRQGYGIQVAYEVLKDLAATALYDDFGEVFGDKKTQNIGFVGDYNAKIQDIGKIRVYDSMKRIHDNIADDLTEVKDEQGNVYVGADPLAYKDSLANVFYIESEYSGYKGLTVNNKFRFNNNYQYTDTRNVKWAGFLTNVVYDYKPDKRLTVSPQWRCRTEKGLSSPENAMYDVYQQINYFILKATYKIFDMTTVTGGVQYKMVCLPLDTSNEYNGLNFIAQIVSRAGGYPLIVGYIRNFNYYSDQTKNSRDETVFIKIYQSK